AARRERGGRLVPDPLQRASRGRRLQPPHAAVRRPLGARAVDSRPECAARQPGRARAQRGQHRRALADVVATRRVSPAFVGTYRLMFGPGFGFRQARELVPYLRDLGVSHLYLPPSFQARAGSTHGYDVVDPGRISQELGGEAEFRALADAAHAAGLGIVLDVVPNHMAADDANPYWADEQRRAQFFDI